MDCKTARLLWDFARPRLPELEADEAAVLAHHLAECPDCRALHQAERAIDERLGRAMRDVPVPPDLRGRILDRLAVQRRILARRRVVRIGAGLAAALLLSVLGWYCWPARLIQLDLVEIHNRANTLAKRPALSATRFNELFQKDSLHFGIKERLLFDFPARLNAGLVKHQGICELQGHRVPFLILQNGTNYLRVYILDGKRFDLNYLANMAGTLPSDWVTLDVEVSSDGNTGWLYEYTGGSLERFFSQETIGQIDRKPWQDAVPGL